MKTDPTRTSSFRAFRVGVVAGLVLADCGIGGSIWFSRLQTLEAGVTESRNLALVLSGHMERSIQSVDIVLRGLQSRIERVAVGRPSAVIGEVDAHGVSEALQTWMPLLVHVDSIAVADARGKLVATTTSWSVADIDVADRDYFRALQSSDDDQLKISLPFKSRLTGRDSIALARRLNGPDRRFIGTVFVTVSARYIASLYETVSAPEGRTFALLRRDGTLVFRHPQARGDTAETASPTAAALRDGVGVSRSAAAAGVPARWIATAALRNYPLVATIATPEDAILAQWRTRVLGGAAGAAFCLAGVAALLLVMARRGRKLSESFGRLQREHAAALAKAMSLDACINNMSQGVVMLDADARFVLCNGLYADMYRLAREQLKPGLPLRDFVRRQVAGGEDIRVKKLVATLTPGEPMIEEFKWDGRIIEVKRHALGNGGWVAIHEDITARRRAEARIEQLAHNDLLTGIANRSQFLNQINRARRRLEDGGDPFAVLMIDLDHFKHVNDTLGHAAGDALLKEIVKRLRASLRTTDLPARIGGDEFAIIQGPSRASEPTEEGEPPSMRDSAIVLANRILELIAKPFDIDGHEVVVGASIGIALAPEDGVEPDELMKRADLALYKIKAEGRNGFALFSSELAAEADVRSQFEAEMRDALVRNEFELHFQPLVDLAGRRPCAMEALVRWNHPVHGLITPDRFIEVAEQSGLIVSLGEWVIRNACAAAVAWPPHTKLVVNVSPVQFRKANVLDTIMLALVESGLVPERLEIDVTERVLLDHSVEHIGVLHQLKNLGISVALDDFGTGYSSLSSLTEFPFDRIKIDGSFSRGILDRQECAAVVCAVASLTRSLGTVTLAEGVETEAQVQALRAAGVTQAQGFLFGRPAPAAQLRFDEVENPAA